MNTKDLHPGLGSGALRKRLCERITSYLTLGGLFNAELANHDAVRELLGDCRVALSLSSPIEPARIDKSELTALNRQVERYRMTGENKQLLVPAAILSDMLKEIEQSRAQASSEIREALPTINKALDIYLSHALDAVGRAEEQRKRMPFDHDNNDALERYVKWRDAAYQALNAIAALAPSRQGAAKRVEG